MGLQVDVLVDVSDIGEGVVRALIGELKQLANSPEEWPLRHGELQSVSLERLHAMQSAQDAYYTAVGDIFSFSPFQDHLAASWAILNDAVRLADDSDEPPPDTKVAFDLSSNILLDERFWRTTPDPQLLLRLAAQELVWQREWLLRLHANVDPPDDAGCAERCWRCAVQMTDDVRIAASRMHVVTRGWIVIDYAMAGPTRFATPAVCWSRCVLLG